MEELPYTFSIQNGSISIASGSQTLEEIEIRLFTVSGKLVYSKFEKFVGKQSFAIPVDGLSSGVYFVQLQSNNGSFQRKLFVGN